MILILSHPSLAARLLPSLQGIWKEGKVHRPVPPDKGQGFYFGRLATAVIRRLRVRLGLRRRGNFPAAEPSSRLVSTLNIFQHFPPSLFTHAIIHLRIYSSIYRIFCSSLCEQGQQRKVEWCMRSRIYSAPHHTVVGLCPLGGRWMCQVPRDSSDAHRIALCVVVLLAVDARFSWRLWPIP